MDIAKKAINVTTNIPKTFKSIKGVDTGEGNNLLDINKIKWDNNQWAVMTKEPKSQCLSKDKKCVSLGQVA